MAAPSRALIESKNRARASSPLTSRPPTRTISKWTRPRVADNNPSLCHRTIVSAGVRRPVQLATFRAAAEVFNTTVPEPLNGQHNRTFGQAGTHSLAAQPTNTPFAKTTPPKGVNLLVRGGVAIRQQVPR